MKFCPGCPTRLDCSTAHFQAKPLPCATRPQRASPGTQAASALPDAENVSLQEAVDIAIRHWELHGARGFDASITLLKRAGAWLK